ncbi:rRNA (adenosine-2'-O-)-methyltransferase [Candidatus Rubidus massiliensis]|nr:MAG: hypothetical protein BGO10_00040 [Chlamydia sp. 32-24]CDZ79764.1 rRNA (adenosine-2'-O-)-methyltransferase [Candidatus Rubidus massiliensis]
MKTITSLQNPLVKHFVKLRQNSDYRHEHKTFFIDSLKVIEEISTAIKPLTLLVTDKSLIPSTISQATDVIIVPEEIIQKITGLNHPEGIIAEFTLPYFDRFPIVNTHQVILDHISDPGNLGSIFRTALGFGWHSILLTQDCCDPYNEKALRASRGAIFHLPHFILPKANIIQILQEEGKECFIADINGVLLEDISKNSKPKVIVLSNESSGPSPEFLERGTKITIPMQRKLESLNVSIAGGIIMYALRP